MSAIHHTTAGLMVLFVFTCTLGARADTATIDFNCGTGRLDFKVSGAGDLIASGNRAVFTGPNVTMLSDGNGSPEVSSGTVTIHVTNFTPSAVSGSLAIRFTDGTTIVQATVFDLDENEFPDAVVSDGTDLNAVEFFAPNAATNFMTLTYNPVSQQASVTIQGFGGNTATINDVNVGPVQMGVAAFSSAASFGDIAFTGVDVPLFPPLPNPASLWVDCGAPPCGNGAESYPFNLLADAVAAADPAAMVSLVPGTNSSETFSGGGAIDASLTLANSNPGAGSVQIGVIARRSTEIRKSTSGFISRSSR